MIGPSARAAVELTLESARALHAALGRVIEAAEQEAYGRPAEDAPGIAAGARVRMLAGAEAE